MGPSPEKLNRVISKQTSAMLDAAPEKTPEALRDRTIATLASEPFVSVKVVAGMVRLAEGFLAAATGLLLAHFYLGFNQPTTFTHHLPIMAASALALPLLANAFGLYRISTLLDPGRSISTLWACWTLLFAVIAVGVFLAKLGTSYSRVWLLGWYLAGLSALTLSRVLTTILVRHWNRNGRFNRHAVLIGGGQPAADLIAALESSHNTDVSIVGIFDDRDDERSPPVVQNLPRLGNISELVEFVRQARIDLLLVTLPLAAEQRLLDILKSLWVLPVDIRLSAYAQRLHYRPRAYSYIGNVPFLDVFDKPLGDWGTLIKAIEDKVIATLALIVLSPLMLLIALAIRLESKGPVLFRQKRYGFNNELIEVLKFRSMYTDMADADAAKLVTRGDPRVTRVGRFIRRTSLDELPQFINVLRGELSLVGPRPHATKAKAADQLYTDVVDSYYARHRVKPGITGWAQINGWRGETDTADKLHRRVDHDLYYIENWSLGFDLYILLKTPFALLKSENAF